MPAGHVPFFGQLHFSGKNRELQLQLPETAEGSWRGETFLLKRPQAKIPGQFTPAGNELELTAVMLGAPHSAHTSLAGALPPRGP